MTGRIHSFRERGRAVPMLWVYRENARRRFHEKMGGQIIEDGFDDDIPDAAYDGPLPRLYRLAAEVRPR